MIHPFTGVITAALFLSLAFTSCSKNDSVNNGGSGGSGGSGTASTAINITDAPIDDASVTGAFVTITDIKLDGQSVQGFTKATVDLKAYVNGNTKALGTYNLAGKTYSTISFVLDFDTDAFGASPGCYVVNNIGLKSKLQSSSNVITVSKNFALTSGASNSLVADFDLRKMIIHQSGAGTDRYDFATAAELSAAVRVVTANSYGTMSGTLTDLVSGSAKVVAYVYKKGTFNRNVEMQGQGASSIQFANAVNSSMVNNSGYYQLHFLESGDYEIHFASYKDTNADGEYELQGTLSIVGAAGIDFLNLHITTNVNLQVNATATGILP